ncbi:hypothetical protein Zm00014a_017982 [Zea mays]|uniref:Survival protein SurE-like phosphatase/nucleotidase domain-containing protein n=1 Tax=Zea mays TaxID=4577 RepID=A0A3L6DFB7_MAIZE|nr:hypothetical protein Zm00014a_017982 [Zea mays]
MDIMLLVFVAANLAAPLSCSALPSPCSYAILSWAARLHRAAVSRTDSMLSTTATFPKISYPWPLGFKRSCVLVQAISVEYGSQGLCVDLRVVIYICISGQLKVLIHFKVVDPSKKGRYLTKKRLKLQRKRIKNERKEANKNDQQSIRCKGKKIKQKFLKAKARLKYKIEKLIHLTIVINELCRFHSSVITTARKALVYGIPSIAISLNWKDETKNSGFKDTAQACLPLIIAA